MPLMATLTRRRPTADCLGGRLPRDASFRAHRGVVGSVQRAAAAAPDKLQPWPANDGRRQRGRKSHRAGAPVRPQKRVMENIVILKRGETIAPETAGAATVVAAPTTAAEEKVERVAAADRCGAPAKAESAAAAAGQCGDPAVAAKELCDSALEKTEKAPAGKTKTETAAADRCSVPAKKTEVVAAADRCAAPPMKAEVVAGAVQCGTQAEKAQTAPTSHSGASFVISPDPRELPIPVLVLEPRRGRAAACA